MGGMRRVTSTMQLVASANLQKAQKYLSASLPFGVGIRETMQMAYQKSNRNHPASPTNRLLLIVLCSDRGLCGSFNTTLAHEVRRWVNEQTRNGATVDILLCGQKGVGLLQKDFTLLGKPYSFSAQPTLSEVEPLADYVLEHTLRGDYATAWVMGYRYVNTIRHDVVTETLFPYESTAKTENILIREPNDQRLDVAVWRLWLQYRLLEMQQQRAVSEHASRVIAMKNASETLREMEKDLNLKRNRARQAAITNELTEIVAGAELQ